MVCRQTSNIHRQSGYGERREEEARETASPAETVLCLKGQHILCA